MIKQHMMLVLLGTALAAGPAVAQTMNNQSGSKAPAASSSSSTAGGTHFMAQAQPGQWRASKLMGVDIYGSNNEKIGDVSEVLLDKNGNAQAIVIGVGGFLGVGQKDVAVPFDAVQWRMEKRDTTASNAGGAARTTTGSGASTSMSSGSANMDYPDHGVVSMTKDQLKNAPEFKYSSDTSSRSSTGTSAPAGSTNR